MPYPTYGYNPWRVSLANTSLEVGGPRGFLGRLFDFLSVVKVLILSYGDCSRFLNLGIRWIVWWYDILRLGMLGKYPDILTLQEAAKILGVAPLTLKRWEKKGKLKSIRINTRGDRRYTKKQLLAFFGRQPTHWEPLAEFPEVLNLKQAAKAIRVSPITLKRWEKRGRLQPLRINSRGDRRYLKHQLLELLGL